MGELDRRQALRLLGAGGAAAALASGLLPGLARAAGGGPPDPVAATYLRVLLRHTRWAEQQFDGVAGTYPARDFTFAVVLGNAVLLTRDGYDATTAGVDRETLRAHTLATIRRFAASNRLAGGTEWGRKLFFDTTFQSYFVLAARLLWTDLDEATRQHVERITAGQAAYTTALGTGDDPDSGSWTPHGLLGGHVGDTKLEEMGVYAQSLAPALAWPRPTRGRASGAPPSAPGAATRPGCPPPTWPTRGSSTAVRSARTPPRTSTTPSSSKTTVRSARTTRKSSGAPPAATRCTSSPRARPCRRCSPRSRTANCSGARCC